MGATMPALASCPKSRDVVRANPIAEDAAMNQDAPGRPDAAILEMKDPGDNVFYGG
jgi:hypothetical protein